MNPPAQRRAASIDTAVTPELDSTPLSPAEAAAKLEKALQNRPEAADLKSQNILKEGGALAAQRAELEKAMVGDKLSSALAHRPTPEELVAQGILTQDEAPLASGPAHTDKTSGDAPSVSPVTSA